MIDIAPFIMSEYEKSYSLLLVDFDRSANVFRECGYEEIGGYAWHGVADSLIRLRAPHLVDKINFDPEADMFAAYGPDKSALEELVLLLKSALDDDEMLKNAIENSDPDLID